jgi:hypothetical protein
MCTPLALPGLIRPSGLERVMGMLRNVVGVIGLCIFGLAACASGEEVVTPNPEIARAQQELPTGALVDLSMESKVGVLLDEIPPSMRERVAASLLAKPQTFWQERALRQVQLATYRLVFRQYFYGGQKKQLPLPPESIRKVVLTGSPTRVIDKKHDTVVIPYRFESTLLTDASSPAASEPALKEVGGIWNEPFMFPIDPELLLQRTQYSCMDEEDFPVGSVDSEEVDSFYDQDCQVERDLSSVGQCHSTKLAVRSCREAVTDSVGAIDTVLRFTRRAWDPKIADSVRVSKITNDKGGDLQVVESEFRNNRIVYKYIEPNACELQEEKCVTGSGWRRLLQFATSDENVGVRTIDIGAVNYYLTGAKTLNDRYHIFEYSSCHAHYHFTHYGSFSYGGDEATTAKRGFCLQSTDRFSNHELSPLHNPYGGCDYQGVEVGWVDQYKAGLPCQWIDVTDVDTTQGPVTKPLAFHSNPDAFLCEGTPILDKKGNPEFEPTEFKTSSGETVYRPKCDLVPGWDANNRHQYDATVPSHGEGLITTTCTRGQIGPLRNCGFKKSTERTACTVGADVKLRCTTQSGAAPQVVRVCDYSEALRTGIPCKQEESIANAPVTAEGADVKFRCPGARGTSEPGGSFSLYTAPVVDEDAAEKITCTVVQ